MIISKQAKRNHKNICLYCKCFKECLSWKAVIISSRMAVEKELEDSVVFKKIDLKLLKTL